MASITYLNTAAIGVPSKPVVDEMNKYMLRRSQGQWGGEDTQRLYQNVKSNLAQLFGGEASDYAFVPSTSIGMNLFGHSITYPKGSNIVICDLEFPSNFLPWQNIEKLYGVELRVVKSSNGAAHLESFRELIDENTRIVAVSHVQFGTGYRADLKALATEVHKHDGFLVTDIIQSAGWAAFSLVEQDVDFAAGQATKWIAGPIGAGFAYVRDEVRSKLQPRFIGWRSVKNQDDFEYGNKEFRDDAGMLEGGSPPLAVYAGLSKALDILLEIGSRPRENTALDNAAYLKSRLEEVGIQFYEFDKGQDSPIVSCEYKDAQRIEDEFRKHGIFCSARHGRIRVSPSFYNTYDEIDVFIDMLKTMI